MAATLMAAMALSACGAHDDVGAAGGDAVRFAASIGQAAAAGPGSRAAGSAWAQGDEIGIFMVGRSTDAVAEGAANRRHVAGANGVFSPATGHEVYYPVDGSAVDFIAYYPWEDGKTVDGDVAIDVSGAQTASTQAATDLLWARTTAGFTKAHSANVELSFRHMSSKLVMNVVQPSSLTPNNTGLTDADLKGMGVTIKGMYTRNTFGLSDGAWGTPDTPDDIGARTLTDGAEYDAIIIPGSYGEGVVSVVFTAGGEPFTWTLDASGFEGGNEYTYDVTLTRTGVQVVGTITPWSTTDRGPVDAE